jgi:hypothetical protein
MTKLISLNIGHSVTPSAKSRAEVVARITDMERAPVTFENLAQSQNKYERWMIAESTIAAHYLKIETLRALERDSELVVKMAIQQNVITQARFRVEKDENPLDDVGMAFAELIRATKRE